jgi:D-3-phosphoglycerate dehydrogenase
MDSKPLICIPDDFPAVMGPSAAYRALLAQTAPVYYDSLPGSEPALIERIQPASVVVNIRSSSRFTANVFANCPKMRMLSIWGTGTDNIDLEAARRHGVFVTNTPGVAAIAIGEHCLMLMLAAARRIIEVDQRVRSGEWPRAQVSQMHGKTLGVIGLGAIGRRFAQLGAAIGMRVLSWTFNPKPDLGFPHVELDQLLRESDVVSLHLRLSDQTQHFLKREHFESMKRTAIFINTARGPIVDEAAMIDVLREGRIAAAGLDVFEKEPLPPGHPIATLPNVVLTPHSAGVTPETLEAGLQLSIDNVWNWLAGKPANVVVAP